MKRILASLMLLGLVGCLSFGEHGPRHVLYLDPDGAVAWTVYLDEVRSTETDPAERRAAEREWLDAVLRCDHDVARAFRRLAALDVACRVVRDERPYAAVTEARFESVARAFDDFLGGLELSGEVELRREGERTRLRILLQDKQGAREPAAEDAVLESLLPGETSYRFVLTAGRFLEATGFRLEADDTAAVMLDPDDPALEGADGESRYELVWSDPQER